MELTVAITGASGTIYAHRTLQLLAASGVVETINLIMSTTAATVAQDAAALGMELLGLVGGRGDHLIEKLYRDVKAMDIVEGTGQIQRLIMARQLVQFPRDERE